MTKTIYPILAFFIIIQLFSCDRNEIELIGTTWGNDNFGNCMQLYTFKENGEYEYYHCEMDITRVGDYEVYDDTLKLLEYHIDETPRFAGGTGEMNLRFQYNFIIEEQSMKMIYFKDYEYSVEKKIDDRRHSFVRIK